MQHWPLDDPSGSNSIKQGGGAVKETTFQPLDIEAKNADDRISANKQSMPSVGA
jgi:hypothetical protein